jgi:hypothetical protein
MNQQITEHTKLLKAAKDAAAKLHATEHTLRSQHGALSRERDRTWSALASREQVLDQAARLVEDAAARWRQEHAAGWVRQLSGTRDIRVDRIGTPQEREREVRVAPQLPTVQSGLHAPGVLTFDALCGLAPQVITNSLHAMIRSLPDERFGLPEDARAARLAELDAQIAGVEAEHTALVDAAIEAGIELRYLPAVAQRRQAEAQEREREQELAAQRAAANTVTAG